MQPPSTSNIFRHDLNDLKLFSLVYSTLTIPEQWRFSKIIPVHKKGSKCMVENYRPVANLCSTSKIFEKLILNRISQLEFLNNCDITGKGQHGFKKNRGTVTAGLQLQSLKHVLLPDLILSERA